MTDHLAKFAHWQEYDTQLVRPRVVPCYDARRRRYVRRLVWSLGLEPATVDVDGAMDFDVPPIERDQPAAGLAVIHAAQQEMIAERNAKIHQLLADAPDGLNTNEIADAVGMFVGYIRDNVIRELDGVRVLPSGEKGARYGLVGQRYRSDEILDDLTAWLREEPQQAAKIHHRYAKPRAWAIAMLHRKRFCVVYYVGASKRACYGLTGVEYAIPDNATEVTE